jgi:hypothetical protein
MVNLGSQGLREGICMGAFYGAVAWTVYAIVECFFSGILLWAACPICQEQILIFKS